ncbi:DUF3592 domain-containing protein [Salinigranum marinum]|uniref:DUF3592 domain-containing protein n=1 Tax=Salinigranum marinum TaxID=1515595 RepID=UPI002989B59F|nr:DUF3592 domain-containing protein [Salinigranum marinum]
MADDTGISINGPETLRGAVVLLVIGLGVTGYGVFDYVQQSDAVRESVEVDATITEVGVETESSPSSGTGVEYEPRVEFAYEYRGDSHTGTDLFPAEIAPRYDTRSAAESAVRAYEEGTTVTAYVDPDDPDDAFLRHETSNAPLLAVGIGAVFALLGGLSTAKRYRTR